MLAPKTRQLKALATVLFSLALMPSIVGCRGLVANAPANLSAGANSKVTQRFGMHMYDPFNNWPTVSFAYWRLWGSGVSWAEIERSRGVYDFDLLDRYVTVAEQHGAKIIYVLGNTPAWTSTDPNRNGYYNIPGAVAPPSNIQDWQDYVQAVVSRYKGKICAYEIWNEVDLDGYWTGTVSQMVQLAQTAYQTIKQVDPAAFVLAPSVVQNKGRDYVRNFFSAGGDKYSDAVPYHLYDVNPVPEMIVSSVYQAAIDVAHQWGKDVWDTEIGWGPWGTLPSEQAGAAYTARTMILQAALGIKVIVWFSWDDREWVHLPFVGPDFHTPTPAAIAFQQVQAWLLNSTVTCTNTPEQTWQCPVVAPDGKQRYIVWNVLGAISFSIPATWQARTLSDLTGNTQSISGNTITISDLPVLVSP